jgi:hypothetical protein
MSEFAIFKFTWTVEVVSSLKNIKKIIISANSHTLAEANKIICNRILALLSRGIPGYYFSKQTMQNDDSKDAFIYYIDEYNLKGNEYFIITGDFLNYIFNEKPTITVCNISNLSKPPVYIEMHIEKAFPVYPAFLNLPKLNVDAKPFIPCCYIK